MRFGQVFIAFLAALSGIGLILAQTPTAKRTSVKKRPDVFGFIHQETTGITICLLVNGEERDVQFSPTSSDAARNSLFALKGNIVYPNADGKHIFLIGRLHLATKWTPRGADRAANEPYQEFELQGWYILTPFEEWTLNESDFGERKAMKRRNRNGLRRSDFEKFRGREKFDLRAVQRPPIETPRKGQ